MGFVYVVPSGDLNTGAIIEILNQILEAVSNRTIHRGPTPPENPQEGDWWYNTTTDSYHVYRE